MNKFKIIIFLCLALIMFNSCGTVKEGFKNPKKNNSDEFLVEKKSPLVMPPEFDTLPLPNSDKTLIEKNTRKNNIKELISDKKKVDNEPANSNEDLEGSILKKIKIN